MPPESRTRKTANGKRPTRRTTSPSPRAQSVSTKSEPDDKYAPNSWLAGGIGGTEDLEVPSGQLCLVRRPGLQGLMKAGVLADIDSLTALVDKKHVKPAKGKQKPQELDIASLMSDPTALDNVLHTVDKVVCHCVVKPEVEMTPNDVTRRKSGVVYADMIDIMDKMFIFNFVVGGTRDLESFRGEFDELVGGLEAGEGVPAAAK